MPINAETGLSKPVGSPAWPAPISTTVCLLVLLAYSTATVFVRDAWALESFQIGVFALLAVYLLAGITRGKEERKVSSLARESIYHVQNRETMVRPR